MSETTAADEAGLILNQQPLKTGRDIGLFEIGAMMARRKGIIFATFLVAMIVSLAYIFYTDPVYRADAYLLPPRQMDIQALLKDGNGIRGYDIKRYTPERVYEDFLVNLKSRRLRQEFFEGRDLLDHYDLGNQNPDKIFEVTFNRNLAMRMDAKDSALVIVSLRDIDPIWAAQILGDFIDFANKRTARQLVSDISEAIKAEIDLVNRQLSSKVSLAESRRMDKVQEMLQALDVAKALGIEDASAVTSTTGNQANVAVNIAEMPLYLRGTQALKAEIAELKSRESDEAFIDGLRNLQERRFFLENILIDAGRISTVSVDFAPQIPHRSEMPAKIWIILLSGIIGFLVGILAVLLVEVPSRLMRESNARSGQ